MCVAALAGSRSRILVLSRPAPFAVSFDFSSHGVALSIGLGRAGDTLGEGLPTPARHLVAFVYLLLYLSQLAPRPHHQSTSLRHSLGAWGPV